MELSEYQSKALRTSGQTETFKRLLNCVLGLIGELGECFELLKKHYFHGHTLDKTALKKEAGDFLWYGAEFCSIFNFDLNEIAEMNIAKLQKRYPEKFLPELSRNRTE